MRSPSRGSVVRAAIPHLGRRRRGRPADEGGLPANLVDRQRNDELRRDGFTVVPLVPPETAQGLLERCLELHPVPRGTWESDFYEPDPAVKRAAHRAIADALAPGLDSRLVEHRPIMHNFVMNWPGPDGGLVLHQHSTVVDERRFRSVIVWCALSEATEANGTLHVVPRSHLLQKGPRPERTPSWHEPHIEALLDRHLVPVPLRPGEALVMDNQLLHCSFANQTSEPRVSAATVLVPGDAVPMYYETAGTDRVRAYRLDPDFFLRHDAGQLQWARPTDLELLEERPWSPTVVDRSQVDALPAGSCRHHVP